MHLGVVFLLAVLVAGSARGAEPGDYRRVLSERAGSLVTVKFVLSVSFGGAMGGMMGGDQEIAGETTGLMISEDGLVLCSNTQLGGLTSLMSRLLGPMSQQLDIKSTPGDFEVLIGDATEGLAASLVVRDSERDLVWIRITDPGDRKFEHFDLSRNAEAELADEFVVLRRMDKSFDREAGFLSGRIGTIVDRPRPLYVPATALGAAYGLPVFDLKGNFLGLTVLQIPEDFGQGVNPMMMGLQATQLQESMAALILPAAEVARATRSALAVDDDEEG